MAHLALEGLRVIEFGDFISSAYAGKLLADLGADVVKVEPPQGDSLRRQGPFPGDQPHPERSGLHLFLNTNKRSVTLDLDDPGDRSRFIELSRSAGLLLHNLLPARLEQLGLTHEELLPANPGLVMVSITTFGYDTPYRDWKGTALNATVASGVSFRIGDPDRAPLWIPYCAADFQGGVHGAIAGLMALRARKATGEGQHAWVSTVELIGTYLSGSALAGYVFNGQLRGRAGRHMAAFYPWEVAPVADGYFEIITMVDDQWNRFVELMGNPDWRTDERFTNRWLAYQWADELDAYWHPWLRQRTKAELSKLFSENRIAFQPVNAINEVVESEHLEARDFWQQVDHPVIGRHRLPGAPYRLQESPWSIRRPAPLLGQHTAEVLAEVRPPASPPPPSHAISNAPPLAGLRVLDHGHVWAGPLLGGTFVDFGAEVISIKSPSKGSGVVMGGQALGGTVAAGATVNRDDPKEYHGFDRGKKSITLDLGSPEGREVYLQLVAKSDVIIENFSSRVLPSLGLGYVALRQANPGIILASMSATGATPGPWRDLVTYGPSLAALYGIKSLLGYHDDPMPREDTADLDPTAAGHAFVAIAAALEYRDRTGHGQHIEMAQGEATIQRIAEPVMDYLLNGRVHGPQGNRYPGVAPHGVYPAAGDDRWISIVARDDSEWSALLRVAGSRELADARFETLAGRLATQDDLDAAIGRWTAGCDAWELTERLQAAGVPAYPVMGPSDLLADPNYDALRQSHVRLSEAIPIAVDQLYQGVPWKLTKTPGIIQGPMPALGADNAEVYGNLLGLSEPEQVHLRDRGVI
jgi:crotonobetainyl-CoA:carnitine CoA-transferase CaiB-like acyl-CoA transferase